MKLGRPCRTSRKIAISLPAHLLRAVEELRRPTGESRSGFLRRALERLLAERARAQKVALYVGGYRRHPETAREIAAAQASAVGANTSHRARIGRRRN